MKFRILIFFIFCLNATLQGQYTTQSAEGKSSLPLPLNGAGVSIDIGKTEVVLGLNNYGKVFKPSVRDTIGTGFWGVSLSGKSNNGITNLFEGGEIVSEGNLIAFGGYSLSNNNKLLKKYNEMEPLRRIDDVKSVRNLLNTQVYPDSVLYLLRFHQDLIADIRIRDLVILDLTRKINAVRNDPRKISEIINAYKYGEIELTAYLDKITEDQTKIASYINTENDKMEKLITSLTTEWQEEFSKSVIHWRLSVFAQGGIGARSFKRYIGTSLPDFNNSFQDTLFRGGHLGMGLNFLIGDFTFGISYNYLQSDNFRNLTNKEYSIRSTEVSGTQTFSQEKKISAFSGKYSWVEVNEFNLDILYSIKLDKTDTSRLLLNPYIRGSWHSRNADYLANYTNIGLGAYFLGKGRKFIGGLYIELPDINNNVQKALPEENRNLQSPFRKLSFGIVTKFNLSSIFAFVDRPSNPD